MTSTWDSSYAAESAPTWDLGRPQPAIVGVAEAGLLTGQRVLDVGCGTGEHALLAATHGARAVGVDISPAAIELALAKAAQRGLDVQFQVADALADQLPRDFDVLIDVGVFHVFSDEDRPRYVASLAHAARPGGALYLMCFSDRQPGTWGPRRVSAEELRAAFSDGWAVQSIEADTIDIRPLDGVTHVQGWFATVRRR